MCTTYSDRDEPRISNTIPVRCITIIQRSLHARPHALNTPPPRKAMYCVYNNTHICRQKHNASPQTTNNTMHPPNWQTAMGSLQHHRSHNDKKQLVTWLYDHTHALPHTHHTHRNIHRLIYLVTSLRAVCTTYSDPDEPRISNTIPVRCITIIQRSLHARSHAHNTPAPRKVLHSVYNNTHICRQNIQRVTTNTK